jgi:hypothetical protein
MKIINFLLIITNINGLINKIKMNYDYYILRNLNVHYKNTEMISTIEINRRKSIVKDISIEEVSLMKPVTIYMNDRFIDNIYKRIQLEYSLSLNK